MKRRSVFAWIAGLLGMQQAAAQEDRQATITESSPLITAAGACECPVCLTKAEPFIRGTDPLDAMRKRHKLDPAESRITRCKNCNAAFWQDAEDAK